MLIQWEVFPSDCVSSGTDAQKVYPDYWVKVAGLPLVPCPANYLWVHLPLAGRIRLEQKRKLEKVYLTRR